jgi:glycosyltransferase involved in cell wall biosynthesis
MTEKVQIKTPLVSVVIPTYNRSKELARAIKSVLNQTYQNFEILVVDDGSEENLRVVCDSFNDQRIRFLRNNTHTNANVARNRGIKEAQGEYIAMLDSDDEYLPHHLSRRVEKIKEWDCDGIFGSAYIDNGEEQTLKLSRPVNKGELMLN